jgi:hypothetical protein
MIHSRPGFASRTSDETPAKLNADMIPAINRKQPAAEAKAPQVSEALLDARAEAAMKKLSLGHPASEVIVNPSPSDPPQVLEPGK